MRKSLSKKLDVFLSLDHDVLRGYYNPQDPAPLYKRQLSNEFEQYIMNSVRSARRNSKIFFKISYRNDSDADYAEPLMYAIRRHFSATRQITAVNFENFKRRTFKLLFVSFSVVMICHGLLPLLLKGGDTTMHSGLSNSLDVFSWVIMWKPIDRLIFYWNPFLKDLSILEKLEKGEVIMEPVDD